MSVQDKISKKFRGIQGGLFEKVSKADVGTALNLRFCLLIYRI